MSPTSQRYVGDRYDAARIAIMLLKMKHDGTYKATPINMAAEIRHWSQ